MVLGYREDRIQYSPFGTSQGVRILFFLDDLRLEYPSVRKAVFRNNT